MNTYEASTTSTTRASSTGRCTAATSSSAPALGRLHREDLTCIHTHICVYRYVERYLLCYLWQHPPRIASTSMYTPYISLSLYIYIYMYTHV